MKKIGRTCVATVAAGALTLALSGVAAASPMDAGGMNGGATGGAHMGATTQTMTPGQGGMTAGGADHMDPGTMDPGTMDPGTMDPGTMDPGTMDPGTMDPGTMGGGPMGPDDMVGGPMGPDDMGAGHMFTDVAASDWYQQYAEQMAGHGFMTGFADGTFGGYQDITRGQFAGIMARMMGLDPVPGDPFTDTAGFWGAAAIQALAQNGIVAGYANGAFGPYDDITRAQMAAMMDRAWEWMAQNGATAGIGMGPGTGMGPAMDGADMVRLRDRMRQLLHDVQGNWAEDHIAHMFDMGVVQGDQNGMFHPDAATTRAQAGAMLWRWYEAAQQPQQ